MDIRVSGHQVDIGDAFKAHCTTRLSAVSDKYFSDAIRSTVTLSRQARGHGFHVDCVMHVSHGVMLKSESEAADAHAALDGAADRIEKQLRRYKRRLRNHQAGQPDLAEARSYVLHNDSEQDEAPEADNPLVIAETQTNIPSVAVGDAVMLLDLAHAPALMFRNVKTGLLNMIYRRADGHVGWVEPNAS